MKPNEEEKEINGIIFTKLNYDWKVLDLSYGVLIGYITKQEGPGYVLLLNANTRSLDYGQLATLAEFINELNKGLKDA